MQFTFEPNLSTGEEKFIYIITNIFNTIKSFAQAGFNKSMLFIFDEPDLFLHPNWQKQFINIMIDFLNEYYSKYNFQIIITTHSPFILSDLPKENIIFMKDGKNVGDEVDIETFGANIHTLLSHAFFMEDGLMGEYASEKINDVINYLNNEESEIKNDEEAQKTINLIGEPIIRNELQRRLDSKKLKKIDEIDRIRKEIKILKEKLKDLENEKNNNN